jgi:hypothetical protein
MDYFLRALRDAAKSWPLLLASFLCSAGVASLWGANIAALFPIIEVTLNGDSLQSWNGRRMEDARKRIEINVTQERVINDQLASGLLSAAEAATARKTLDTVLLNKRADEALLYSSEKLDPWLHRFLPADPFTTVLWVVAFVVASTFLKHAFLLTNTLIVAGREEGVALVEVLIKDLDSDRAANWIEPLIIPLTFADASTLARTLDEVLVKGASLTPEAMGLQKQFGRLRVSVDGRPVDPEDRQSVIQADLFAPVTGLVITSDAVMNSLIVVGTPANNKVVQAMVAQLDVEAASAANAVRVFPLVHASSDRVAGMIRDLFRQRESLPDMRPQDKLIITSDVRTNALIVATSPKSVAIALIGVGGEVDGVHRIKDPVHQRLGLQVPIGPGSRDSPRCVHLPLIRLDGSM